MYYPKCTFVCIIYYNKCILNNFTLRIFVFIKVTTKGAGLNPNAKVWQEIPSHQSDVTEWTEDTTWLLTYPPAAVMSEGMDVWVHIIPFTQEYLLVLHLMSACNSDKQQRRLSSIATLLKHDDIQDNHGFNRGATVMKLKMILSKHGSYYKTQLLLLCF